MHFFQKKTHFQEFLKNTKRVLDAILSQGCGDFEKSIRRIFFWVNLYYALQFHLKLGKLDQCEEKNPRQDEAREDFAQERSRFDHKKIKMKK